MATARWNLDRFTRTDIIRAPVSLYGIANLRTKKTGNGERISREYEQIFQMIVHGRLPPGARIAEGPLAEMLGVSRTPVRESLQRLRQEGLLIEVGGGTGQRGRLAVAPLERKRMEELYSLAAAIEALGVRGLSKVEQHERDELARRLEKIERDFHAEARRRTPEYDRLFELHQAFHRALVETAAGPETLAVLRTIKPQLDRYEWFYAPMAGPDFTPTRREHSAIVKAVRRGTAQELERAVRTNWLNAAQRLGPLIERFDGRLPAGAPIFSISNTSRMEAATR
jgi:DNA-binding GntR family transcriptional regulator